MSRQGRGSSPHVGTSGRIRIKNCLQVLLLVNVSSGLCSCEYIDLSRYKRPSKAHWRIQWPLCSAGNAQLFVVVVTGFCLKPTSPCAKILYLWGGEETELEN